MWPNQLFKELTGRKEEKNPVKKLYHEAFKAGIGRWICGMAVTGLAAGVVSMHPEQRMMGAAIYNLVVGGIHVFLFGPRVSPMALTNPRPPIWYLAILAISTMMWAAAFIVMFVVSESGDRYEAYRLEERQMGALREVGSGALAMLENIALACACFAVVGFLFCLYQCYNVHRLFTSNFKKSEMREAYRRINKIPDPKERNAQSGV